MTNRQKIAYVRQRAKFWKKKLNFDPKYEIEIVQASAEAEEAEDDGIALTEGSRLEEQIVTQIERSLLGETMWKMAEKVRKKCAMGGALMDFDDKLAQYFRMRIRVYSCLLSADGDDFRLLANACTLHEMFHGVLCPLSMYVKHLEEK